MYTHVYVFFFKSITTAGKKMSQRVSFEFRPDKGEMAKENLVALSQMLNMPMRTIIVDALAFYIKNRNGLSASEKKRKHDMETIIENTKFA